MTEQTQQRTNPKIAQIIKAKMGTLNQWKTPKVVRTIGPYIPNAFQSYSDRVDTVRIRLTEYLAGMTSDEISMRFDIDGMAKQNGLWDASMWQDLLTDDIGNLKKSEPVWFAAGLGHSDYAIDIGYWAKMPFYELDEAILLSLGCDPRKANLTQMINDCDYGEAGQGDVLDFVCDRSKQLSRQFNAMGNSGTRVPSKAFLDFVEFVDLPINVLFVDALIKIHDPNRSAKSGQQDVRERKSLMQIIYMMAVDGYGFDPVSKRNKLSGELFELAKLNNIEISRETIRNHLNASKSYYTKPWKTE
jgi:hypothetical protein